MNTQREDIIRDDNTAQSALVNIISGLKTDVIELIVDVPLHGDLDLSILLDVSKKFDRLRTIHFGQGKITSIRNIPVGISKLICSDNMIDEFTDLPNSLLYLDVARNFLTKFDFTKVPHLEEFHGEDNKITEFHNIPVGIVAIYCDNNDLKLLDLKGLKKLKTLHCSNNPIIIIDNLPENIVDFVSENNPIPAAIATTNKKNAQDTSKQVAYLDGLNTFYKLKSKYEERLLLRKRSVGRKKAKGDCIGCKRPVNTIFTVNAEGHFAICGDRTNPCSLNIKLKRGNTVMIETELNLMKVENETAKERIIKLKLDTLFDYIPESKSAALFKSELELFNDTNLLYSAAQKRHDELYNNPHKRALLTQKSEAVHEIQKRMQGTLDEYAKQNRDKRLLKAALDIYKDELMPEMSNLGRLKYEICEMVEDSDTLYQSEVALAKMEYVYGNPPTVEKFNR
jgi:hypothetical protein